MNKIIQQAMKSAHDEAGKLFPSLKADFVRRVNKNPTLSNAIRHATGMEEIPEPIEEETIGVFTAAKRDAHHLSHMAITSTVKTAKESPFVRQQILPLLDKTPKLRSWLKKAVYGPSPVIHTVNVTDARCLTRRGLKLYGMLQAMEARGED